MTKTRNFRDVEQDMTSDQGALNANSPSVGQIFAILWQRKLYVLIGGLLGLGLTLLLTASLAPKYVSRATLLVDLRQLEVTSNTLMPNAPPSLLETLVNSERSLLTSQNVLMRVVDANKLITLDEYGGASGLGLIIGALKTSFGLGGGGKNDARAVAAAKLRKNLTVQRKKDTLVLAVSVASIDADRARVLTRSVLDIYLAERADSSQAASSKVVSALQGQLSDQVKRLTAAEDAVEQYKIANGIVSAKGQRNDEQQIATVTDQLNGVQLQTAQIKARLTQAKEVYQSGLPASGSPDLFKSGLITDLRGRLTAAQEQRASLQSTLGPSHPQMQAVTVRIQSLEDALQSEMRKAVRAIEQELASAQGVERSLGKDLADLRLKSGQTNKKLVPLRELERKVEAARSVYVATLTRIREIRSQQGVDSSNVRVLSEPSLPLQSEAVSRKMLLLLGGLLGASFGALLGYFTSFRRDNHAGQQQITAITGLPQLAKLPLVPVSVRQVSKARGRRKKVQAGGLALPKLYDLEDLSGDSTPSIEPLYARLREEGDAASQGGKVLLVSSLDGVDSSGYAANLAALACEEGDRVLLLVDDEENGPLASFVQQTMGPPSSADGGKVRRRQNRGREQDVVTVDCCLAGFSQGGRLRHVQRQLGQLGSLMDRYDWVVIDGQGLEGSCALASYAQSATQIVLIGSDGPGLLDGLNKAHGCLGASRDKVVGFVSVSVSDTGKSAKKLTDISLTLDDLPLHPVHLEEALALMPHPSEQRDDVGENINEEVSAPRYQSHNGPRSSSQHSGWSDQRRSPRKSQVSKPTLASSGNVLCIRYSDED